jgi:hypothetical protein
MGLVIDILVTGGFKHERMLTVTVQDVPVGVQRSKFRVNPHHFPNQGMHKH